MDQRGSVELSEVTKRFGSTVAVDRLAHRSAAGLGLARTVRRPEIAAMATILIGLTLVSMLLAAVVLRRSGDNSSKIAATSTGGG